MNVKKQALQKISDDNSYEMNNIQKLSTRATNTLYDMFVNNNIKNVYNSKDSYVLTYAAIFYFFNQQDVTTALKYLKKAIKMGNTDAYYFIANCHYANEDNRKAEKYYLLAVENGNVSAMSCLASLYEQQMENASLKLNVDYLTMEEIKNISENYYEERREYYKNQTIKYYKMAMEHDVLHASLSLGWFHYDCKEYDLAENYFKIAAETGDARAISCVGFIYDRIYDDAEKAYHYYKIAFDAGHHEASAKLGYYNTYISKNYEQAKKYYQLGMATGDIECIVGLALYYEKIEKNYILALKYYELVIIKTFSSQIDNEEKELDYDNLIATFQKIHYMIFEIARMGKIKTAIRKMEQHDSFPNPITLKLPCFHYYIGDFMSLLTNEVEKKQNKCFYCDKKYKFADCNILIMDQS